MGVRCQANEVVGTLRVPEPKPWRADGQGVSPVLARCGRNWLVQGTPPAPNLEISHWNAGLWERLYAAKSRNEPHYLFSRDKPAPTPRA